MKRRNLPLKALRAFESAAKHCHLGRAAEELGVTHGAVSHQIRALEQQLAMPLFDRSKGRLGLTPSGVRLLGSVEKAFDELIEGTSNLQGESLRGQLLLACPPGMMQIILPRLDEFLLHYPEIELKIDVQPVSAPPRVSGADVVINYGKPLSQWPRSEALFARSYFPACSPALLHGQSPPTNTQDLLKMRLVHDDDGREWASWLQEYGQGGKPKNNLYVSGYAYAIDAAREACGVVLADQAVLAEDLRAGRLIRLLEPLASHANSYFICTQSQERLTRRVEVFEAWLRDILRSL